MFDAVDSYLALMVEERLKMDPSGGWFLKIILALILFNCVIWIVVPSQVAISVNVVSAIGFVGFVIYILSTARFD